VALCAAICDANTWVDVAEFGKCKLAWFRKFMPFAQGVPSHDTFTEVFARREQLLLTRLYVLLELMQPLLHFPQQHHVIPAQLGTLVLPDQVSTATLQ